MISICIPTRGRPEIFKKTCQSILDNAFNPDNIEFVIYRDEDDTTVYEYLGNYKLITEPPHPDWWMGLRLNECWKIATGPIYMFSADDVVFESKDWDKFIEAEFEKYPDKLVLVVPDFNDWERLKFGVVGFLHKNWTDLVGFMPTVFGSQSSDRWLDRVAMKINRRVHLKEMYVNNLNIRDEMHSIKNRRGREEQWTLNYHKPELVKIRKKQMNILLNTIENGKRP